MQGKRKYVRKIQTRDPMPVNRDPQIEIPIEGVNVPPVATDVQKRKYSPRTYIRIDMRKTCIACAHNLRNSNGSIPVPNKHIMLRNMTCTKCGRGFLVESPMSLDEEKKYGCVSDAYSEYIANEIQP